MATNTPKTIVLITGANRGIGLEMTASLLRTKPTAHDTGTANGPYHVILCSRDAAKGTQAAASLTPEHGSSVSPLQLDVTSQPSIEAAAETVRSQFGRVDVLVNNAGILRRPTEPGVATLRETLETNLVSAFAVTETFRSLLLTRDADAGEGEGKGKENIKRLIHVTSDFGSVTRHLDASVAQNALAMAEYRISKAGLNMLAAVHANVLRGAGVRVVAFNPGWTATAIGDSNPEEVLRMGARPVRDVGEAFVRIVRGERDGDLGRMVEVEGTLPW